MTPADTNWDVDKYRRDYESDEHWMLRKSFIETHKDQFPEDNIVRLAQVFINVEILGCKYHDKVMTKVALLAKDVDAIREYREDRVGKLKRTFVTASDAAGAKVKGAKSAVPSKPTGYTQFVKSSEQFTSTKPTTSFSSEEPLYRKPKMESHEKMNEETNPLINFKYGNFILFDSPTINNTNGLISHSAGKSKCIFEVKYTTNEDSIECAVFIDNTLVAKALDVTKKKAYEEAISRAYHELKGHCYTIKIRSDYHVSVDKEIKTESEELNKIECDNVGYKLMKNLGWSGGALGKGGITEPIQVAFKGDRKGFGMESSGVTRAFIDKYNKILKDYIIDNNQVYDLIFSKDFSKEERAELHKIARKLQLKSQSHGKGDDRYLKISKKIDGIFILMDILNNGEFAKKYEAIPPRQLSN